MNKKFLLTNTTVLLTGLAALWVLFRFAPKEEMRETYDYARLHAGSYPWRVFCFLPVNAEPVRFRICRGAGNNCFYYCDWTEEIQE